MKSPKRGLGAIGMAAMISMIGLSGAAAAGTNQGMSSDDSFMKDSSEIRETFNRARKEAAEREIARAELEARRAAEAEKTAAKAKEAAELAKEKEQALAAVAKQGIESKNVVDIKIDEIADHCWLQPEEYNGDPYVTRYDDRICVKSKTWFVKTAASICKAEVGARSRYEYFPASEYEPGSYGNRSDTPIENVECFPNPAGK